MIDETLPTESTGIKKVVTEIYAFPPDAAAVSNWDAATRCSIALTEEGDMVHIIANVAGLRSLARHCLTIIQDGQEDSHFDYDADTGWFDGALGLRITRAWD